MNVGKGFIIRKLEINSNRNNPYVYLESHASYPSWTSDRNKAKVFENMKQIEDFKKFWKKELKHFEITIINLDEKLV